jgi:hypothetical protein
MAKMSKAITAAFSTGAAVFVASAILNNVLEQAAAAVGAGIVAAILVYTIPNAPAPPAAMG